MEHIILASSLPGDLVMDIFVGCEFGVDEFQLMSDRINK